MIKRIILLIHPRLLQLLAVFFLGLVFGSTYIHTQYAYKIDELMIKKQNLQGDLEATKEELEEVKENLSQQNEKVVTSIEPHIIISDENLNKYEQESLEIEIATKIKKILEPIKGLSTERLDYMLIPEIVNGRIITAEDKQFSVKTKLLVISEKVIIHVEASSKLPNDKAKEE